MAIEFKVRLRDGANGLEAKVFAATHRDAATIAMNRWVAAGDVGVNNMPIEAISTTTFIEPHARRFRFEAPPAFEVDDEHCCKECGCSDEDACDPPCSWVTDDVCSNPACVKAAGLS